MLKKAFLLSFILLVFPFFLKGEEWQMIEPPQSYAYLLQFIQENLQAIHFDTEEHRDGYNAELQITINLALAGNLNAVKERVNQIHIPQTKDWITSEAQKKIILHLLEGEVYVTNELYLRLGAMEKIKKAIENEIIILDYIIHTVDCTTIYVYDENGNLIGRIHFRDCATIIIVGD